MLQEEPAERDADVTRSVRLTRIRLTLIRLARYDWPGTASPVRLARCGWPLVGLTGGSRPRTLIREPGAVRRVRWHMSGPAARSGAAHPATSGHWSGWVRPVRRPRLG